MATEDVVSGEARATLRAGGYQFRRGEPPLRAEWKERKIELEGVDAEGETRGIILTARMPLRIPEDIAKLIAEQPPEAEEDRFTLLAFADTVRGDLNDALWEAFATLRWRSAAAGKHVYDRIEHEWRTAADEWKPIYGPRWAFQMSADANIGRLEEEPRLGELLEKGIREPVAHQLLREAANLLKEVRLSRAALVLATAAVEVAVKNLIGQVAPDTRWLMDNLPSPPIPKLMKAYVPLLPGMPDPAFEKNLRRAVHEMNEERNKTVHAGSRPLPLKRLVEFVKAAEDVVWRCDELAGHEWAGERVGMYRITAFDLIGPRADFSKKISLKDAEPASG